jgi:hypothetical protein
MRQCLRSTIADGNFTVEIDAWHGACDKKLSQPVTTPSFATAPTTAIRASCDPIIASCDRWKSSASDCKSSFSASSDQTSCYCQPIMISLGSVCQYDGSRLCLATSAAITDLWEYSACPGASSILNSVSERCAYHWSMTDTRCLRTQPRARYRLRM